MNKYLSLLAVLSLTVGVQMSAFAQNPMGADRHVARGVACQSCHGQDMKNPELPGEATCVKCHTKEALIDKTKAKLTPVNPHAAPHNGDCTLCHLQHEPAVDYCAQCHNFNFNVK